MLKDYHSEESTPNAQDLFPCLKLLPNLEGCTGLFLKPWESLWFDLLSAKSKTLYSACVMAFNKKNLENKVDTPWRSFFGLDETVKPEWRSLYKPPLSKRLGDLQWRVLHGIIAVNSFISILNPEVCSTCPFCSKRETVFHVFVQCFRLEPLFVVLNGLFNCFDELFSAETFILGFKIQAWRGSHLNYWISSWVKLSLQFISVGKTKLGKSLVKVLLTVFFTLVKSRVLIDFKF